jgi:methanogen homocitrate synthase
MHNWDAKVRAGWKLPKKITIHDVTLRDGEQTPGVVFRRDEKLKIAHALADMGVHRIEGGMVSVSQEDAEAIAQMAKEIKTAEIASFSRARKDDIELAIKCNVGRVVIEVPAPAERINKIWGNMGKAVEATVKLIQFAKENGLKVTFFLVDYSRADLETLKNLIVPAVKEGKADNVGVVDTKGCCLPGAVTVLVEHLREWVNVPIEVHCHNTWGMSTANTLAGVAAGAEIVHTCVNGLGGNSSLDECVMGIEAYLGMSTGIQKNRLLGISRMVKDFSRSDWYKPFVGPTVADVEVGIATRLMWDKRNEPGMGRTEFLNYEVVGGTGVNVVLGKKSGGYSVLLKAWQLGLALPTEAQADKILVQIKNRALEKKGLVTEEEFRKFYEDLVGSKS